ncbi:hypothetical protein [Nitrincola tapanii]|uniref:DUF1311 domain-containing protein n=1 Tax=Nitrincola tapanii TaxID=1708751 RepID=A0A5A9W7U2_9GAMM|nr:hypothetical protein [Nitrincola tapanii]KAA0876188.1 hypothetical protein E1H14_00125 [Nitrincola tapanii]
MTGLKLGVLALFWVGLSACSQVSALAPFDRANSAEKVVVSSELEPPLITSLQWTPTYDQPIRQLEALLASQTDLQERNQTISNLAYLHDAQLYMAFHEWLDYLHESARPREVEQQNRWLDQRQDAITAAFKRYEGDPQAPYQAAEAFIRMTKERQVELVQRLSRVRIR